MADLRTQDGEDFGQQLGIELPRELVGLTILRGGTIGGEVGRDPVAHPFGRIAEINEAGPQRADGHVRGFGAVAIRGLGQGQAAVLLDRLDADCAVAVAAGQDHAYRTRALVKGQGSQEEVDRFGLTDRRPERLQGQPSACNAHDGPGRHDVDAARSDRHTVGGSLDLKRREAGQHVREQAFVLSTEMRDDDEGGPERLRHSTEEALHRFDAACGRADADDREVVLVHHRVLNLRIDTAPFIGAQHHAFLPDVEDGRADQTSCVASCTT
ncbi:hypothetical protein AFCDBAGC_2702 [Methylobacterium cerastii]|uniref:Uncharacterized protein n=1 Tax=Methylobacterium cerastii TaxID=932741 RepID=A0ABQ4QHX0_9HYPH|nr:hypothetical protein AFCDBAGC_2702 [Methylobacterium cerastii]